MIKLINSTFIFYIKIDTVERLRNLQIITQFYRKYIDNPQFIFVYEPTDKGDLSELVNDDILITVPPTEVYRRCEAFNRAAKLATTPVIFFNDVDCIIDPHQLLEVENYIISASNVAYVSPYNGEFICTFKKLKDEFANCLDLQFLESKLPENRRLLFRNEDILVGHTSSWGGIVAVHTENFLKCGGYNPNFIGWGWEDLELPERIRKLGYGVTRIGKKNLWHFFHNTPDAAPKETQPYYNHNRQLYEYVRKLSKEDLEKYIGTWIHQLHRD